MKKLFTIFAMVILFASCSKINVSDDIKYNSLSQAYNDKAIVVNMSVSEFQSLMIDPLDSKDIETGEKLFYIDGYVVITDKVIEIRIK